MFIGKYNKPVWLTYLSLTSAVIGVLCSIKNKFFIAFICLILSGVCDMYDGKVARGCERTKMEKEYGVEIDSLSDIIAFVLLPIVIFYCKGFDAWYCCIAYICLALAGLIRLAYFNVATSDTEKAITCYTGLPVTSTAIIFPLVYLISLIVKQSIFKFICPIIFFVTAFMFVYKFKLKKPTGLCYKIFAVMAIIGCAIFVIMGL